MKRFRQALVLFLGGRAVQACARALLVLLLVRVLSIADFGTYMLLVGLAEMCVQAASFGIVPVAYRYLPQLVSTVSYAKLVRFLTSLTVLQLVLLAALCALLSAGWSSASSVFGLSDDQQAMARNGLLLFLLIPAFRFSVTVLEALLEQGKAQLARAAMPVGRALLLCLLIASSQPIDLRIVLLVDVVVTAASLGLAWYLLASGISRYRETEADEPLPMRQMVKFGWHMAGVDLAASASSPGALRAVLANSLGIAETGLFAFLQSLQRLVGRYLPGVLLRGLVRPVLIDRAMNANGSRALGAGSGLLFKANLMGVLIGCVVVATGGDELVSLLSGGKFVDAGGLLLIMFIGLGAISQRAVLEMLMQITGQTAVLRAVALLAPAALLAVWIFADAGLWLAISIIVAAAMVSNGIATLAICRRTDVKIDFRGVATIGVAGIVAALAGIGFREFLPLAAAALLALALFAVLLWRLRPFTVAELNMVERVLGRNVAAFVQRPAESG